MARVYTNNNVVTKGARSDSDEEVSKVDEIDHHESSSSNFKAYSKSQHDSDNESNVIQVQAEGVISKSYDISQDSPMDENEEENRSDHDLQQENDNKSIDNDQSNDDGSTGNVLRRSERARNQNSYGIFNRRSFKYDDDYEYMGGLGHKKGAIEMDPPDSGTQGKRKRKNTTLVAVPFTEGMKRTMSAKTPS